MVLALGCSLALSGCYAGSQFTLEASHLNQPVSMTSAIHNADLQVLTPAEYDELGNFSISFSGWSVGSPLSPNPRKDISDELNDVVKEKGGNGITRLRITATNGSMNYVSAFLRGVSWFALIGGAALLFSHDPDKVTPVATIAISTAGILLLPTVGEFTVEGTVVRIKQPVH